MRVAVIGVGSIGTRHARNLITLGHEVIAVDNDLLALGRAITAGYETRDAAHGIPADVQAVIIATPAETHLDWLEDCDARGLPTLVEKPVGVVADLDALRALRPTKPVMVGYQLRFHEQAVQVKQYATLRGSFSLNCNMKTWPGSARDGDPLLECSHEIDLALWCGAVPCVTSVKRAETSINIEIGGYAVYLEWNDPLYWRDWCGDNGTVRCQHAFESPRALGDQMYLDELAHFLRAVEGGPIAPGCTLEEGIAVLDIVRQVQAYDRC